MLAQARNRVVAQNTNTLTQCNRILIFGVSRSAMQTIRILVADPLTSKLAKIFDENQDIH